MVVLLINHISILCMKLCVSSGSHIQYTYIIDPGVEPCDIPGPCKYFSSNQATKVITRGIQRTGWVGLGQTRTRPYLMIGSTRYLYNT